MIEALARLRPDQIGFYPPYAEATEAVAQYLGVPTDRITLTNGLDEGIMALSVAYLRPSVAGPVYESVVPEPAFEIFRFDTAVAGGQLVQVMPQAGLLFPLDEVLAAIRARTRVVFLTNPNNPTGIAMPLEAIRAIARQVPSKAIVFVDEAYAEFAGVSFIPELASFPNVVVGRTFSKAFGLAGLRIGCLVGAPDTMDADPPRGSRLQREHRGRHRGAGRAARISIIVHGYLRQVAESKTLIYDACDRLGPHVLEELVELRAGVRGRSDRGARQRHVRARDLHPRSIDRTRLRRLHPHRRRASSSTRAGALPRWKRSCAPRRNRSPDD